MYYVSSFLYKLFQLLQMFTSFFLFFFAPPSISGCFLPPDVNNAALRRHFLQYFNIWFEHENKSNNWLYTCVAYLSCFAVKNCLEDRAYPHQLYNSFFSYKACPAACWTRSSRVPITCPNVTMHHRGATEDIRTLTRTREITVALSAAHRELVRLRVSATGHESLVRVHTSATEASSIHKNRIHGELMRVYLKQETSS